MNFYNEHDPRAAAWLRELIKYEHLPAGIVDERSIEDIRPDELRGYTQCHFFAGIGGWSLALEIAGWPEDRPVWTGSCPCQPFSSAGKGGGFADERHLWPAFHHLISQCQPPVIFGEQVASKDGLAWLDLVRADCEASGYSVGAVDPCAATVSAPIIVAFGGGANSTAMLVEMHRRGIHPDLIMFADTGGERPETYDAVSMVDIWCRNRFGIGIQVVRKTYQGKPETLEENCRRMEALPSIAYGFKTCSQKYKISPQDQFVNQWEPALNHWATGGKCEKWIGYDAGEERRAKIREDAKYTFRYPLIEWGIYREDCVAICQSEGLPSAKSSCFFCPSMKRHEITQLAKDHPDLMRRALDMEARAKLTSIAGLGRSFSWAAYLKGEAAQSRLFAELEVPCGCYDGGVE